VRARVLAASLLCFPLLCGPLPALSQSIAITQTVEQTKTIDLATVEQLPAVEQHVSFLTGHGTEQATYTGALLWSVLEKAGVLGSDPRERLHHSVAVTGRDGYVAVLALAEIDPELQGKPVLLAYRRDGQPIPSELRLVVPGDHRGGRSVRDVVRIEIR
jgi:DMSO/TMAO reductase YedYZ molybdopterin-dependent catalytic subunit